jgi:arsenite oxidase small subunit
MKGGCKMSESRHNDELVEKSLSRRGLLKTAGLAGASAFLVSGLRSEADAALIKTYPQVRIANLRDVQEGKPFTFDYPLIGRKNLLLDCGCSVEGGIGPNKGIVAYSMFCTHLGCGVDLDRNTELLICECHQTQYDPRKSGRVVQGPAPNSLPMVSLHVDNATGDIYATGVAGLIYGLRNNLLDGQEVQ